MREKNTMNMGKPYLENSSKTARRIEKPVFHSDLHFLKFGQCETTIYKLSGIIIPEVECDHIVFSQTHKNVIMIK